MRPFIFAPMLALGILSVAACQPAPEEPASTPAQQPIRSTTAPAVGGPVELPKDGGVTPAPDAVAEATADDVAAPVSPAEAAKLGGGEQNKQ